MYMYACMYVCMYVVFQSTCSGGGEGRAYGVVSVWELALPLEEAVGLRDVRVHQHPGAAHHAQAAARVVAHLVLR